MPSTPPCQLKEQSALSIWSRADPSCSTSHHIITLCLLCLSWATTPHVFNAQAFKFSNSLFKQKHTKHTHLEGIALWHLIPIKGQDKQSSTLFGCCSKIERTSILTLDNADARWRAQAVTTRVTCASVEKSICTYTLFNHCTHTVCARQWASALPSAKI